MSRSLLGGGRCTVLPRFDPHAVETAARDGARFVSLVPTALDRINAQLFERILLGGSAIPAVRPANTVATYGMTETVGGVVYEGRPLDGVRVRIRDGVAEFNSPTLLRCYRDGSVPLTAGWYRTGDVATLDESGLQIHGRADDLIISGGENVWPGPVENILGRHPKVAAVAVVGRPDEAWGERVVAVVVPSDPHDPPTVSELRLLVKAQLPAWNAPASLEIVEALPTTALGKVRRHQL
jgi:O-succinylbenzoic acid--CoA ligase